MGNFLESSPALAPGPAHWEKRRKVGSQPGDSAPELANHLPYQQALQVHRNPGANCRVCFEHLLQFITWI